MIVSFDEYYDIETVNTFINNLKENKIGFRAFIDMRMPHNWWFEVLDKYNPVFLKYDIANTDKTRTLIPCLLPVNPTDERYLHRFPSTPASDFEKFVSPNCMKKAKNKPYVCIFKYRSISELKSWSKTLGVRIDILGRIGTYDVAMCCNKFIRGYLVQSNILLEKFREGDYSKPCALEYALYSKVFGFKFKWFNKTRELGYVEAGNYYPMKYMVKEQKLY